MNDAVVVVESECMTSAGATLAATWSTLTENRSGIRRVDRYDPSVQTLQGVSAVAYGGQIPLGFDELAGSEATFRKWCEPAYHAVQALTKAVLTRVGYDRTRHDPQRIALLGATALTSQHSRDALTRSEQSDPKFILNQCQNIPLAAAATEFGLQGPTFCIGSACASSAHAAFLAYQLITAGVVDSAVIVGYEFPLLPASVGGLDWLSALYRRDQPTDRAYADPGRASRPFSRDRRGFVLAEGAGAILLSRSQIARKMGWPVRAIVRGGYSNADADHLTRISHENVSVCIRRAIEAAGYTPDDIECINAHATSTPIGDRSELSALAAVFRDRLPRIPVVANKSQLGHALGAAAMLAMVLAVKALEEQVIPPTLNHEPDPELPRALIPSRAMDHRHHTTLLNAFGFGGTNVSLVIAHPDS
jgi:3-oxoacyl-[acyl-carrier-protein] synthase II